MKFIFILFIVILGCASSQSQASDRDAKMATYKEKYEPLMGQTEEQIVLSKGAPKSIQQAGSIKIFIYHVSHGFVSETKNGWDFKDHTTSYESFDEARIYFRDGKAFKWDADWK